MADHRPDADLLRIGVPSKGRLSELASTLLHDAGLTFRRPERSLFARCRDLPVEIVFLRTADIPVLAAEGAIDLGITGADLVAESGAALGEFGHVKLEELTHPLTSHAPPLRVGLE